MAEKRFTDKLPATRRTPNNAAPSVPVAPASKIINATHTGDATGSAELTFATVNANVGSFGLAGFVAQITTNAKGLITAAANVAISIAATAINDSTAAGRAMLMAATAAAQTALLDVFTSGAKGLAPASGGGTTNFLRADGTWVAPGGGGATNLTYTAATRIVASDTGTDATLTLADGTNPGLMAAEDFTKLGLMAQVFGQLGANYTLTSTVAVQKAFNFSTNGAVTLPTGRYKFQCLLYVLSMSATSGNAAFSLAGTATLARRLMHATGFDNTTPLIVGARGGSASITSATPVSMVTVGTGTGMVAEINGVFDVTVMGTVIPSIALVTAAAAIVQAGSFFRAERIANTGSAVLGTWS